MAKSGAPSRVVERGGSRSEGTRRLLVEAAIATLQEVGFAGASARAIAERAGVNQALIFYHFDSVGNLLLAALDAVSDERMNAYREVVGEARSPRELVEAAKTIFAKDLDAGYITVLVEMIAGASSTPGLGDQVLSRIAPWGEFARTAIEGILGDSPFGSVVPSEDLAHGVVALYLGLEMLSHLSGDRRPALDLFSHVERLANLFEAMTASNPKE